LVAGASYSKRDILICDIRLWTSAHDVVAGLNGRRATNFPAKRILDNAQEFDALTGQDERTTYSGGTVLKVSPGADLYAQYLNFELLRSIKSRT